jgi:biotin--protein ligase
MQRLACALFKLLVPFLPSLQEGPLLITMSNVLVYSGPGVSSSALSHTLKTLRHLLPSYDVQCINAQSLALDPWMKTTSLFVLPGGRDLPFVESLSSPYRTTSPNRFSRADERIREYVGERGGSFLGICAGAYYASSFCEFEKGDAVMQVVGDRKALQFYPGTCRGTVFPGFVYESDKGARMVELAVESEPDRCTTYYNGGGAFIDAERYQAQGVEVLARYISEEQAQASSSTSSDHAIKAEYAGQAAIVRCKVGKGAALLYGTHPEFPLSSGSRPNKMTAAPEAIPDVSLAQLENGRLQQMGWHLQMIGLEVKLPLSEHKSSSSTAYKLTPILLTSRNGLEVESVLKDLQSASSKTTSLPSLTSHNDEGHLLVISDSNDTIHFYSAGQASYVFDICARADYSKYTSPVVAPSSDEARAGETDEEEVDLNKVPKCVIAVTGSSEVDRRLTPHWDAVAFYAHALESRRRIQQSVQEAWATGLAAHNWGDSAEEVRLADVSTYTQVVTSTQTMLDKNYKLLTRLPSGFTSFATHQVSGRGRGKNAWISPLGCLQFSTLLHVLPSSLTRSGSSGVVFVQYLAGLAIVESVRGGMLGPEYSAIGRKIRIKWPNDVYAEVGNSEYDTHEAGKGGVSPRKGTFTYQGKEYAKMAGVLVNSQFSGSKISLVVGCGINTLNPRPTTSLSDLIQAHNERNNTESKLPPVSQEQFAGAIIATFERMWNTFVQAGGSFEPFVEAYRRTWLHS